jgi:LssY-like putative type I secretion system component LssY
LAIFLFSDCALCSSFNAAELQVRLKTRLTSYRTKVGDRFECVVLSPWVENDRVVIPQGATVHGHIAHVTSVGLGLRHERAKLDLVFEDFITSDGRTFPLYAKLSAVDNAREQVTAQGAVRGVIAAGQPDQLVFGVWSSPSLQMLSRSVVGLTGVSHMISSALAMGPAGAGGVLALRLTLFRFPEPEIQYAPGTDMRLQVDQTKQQGVNEIADVPQAAPEGVAEWIGKEPFAIDRRDSRPVSDIVNMAFLGSREQLTRAFAAAGWAEADPPSRKTRTRALYAFNAMRAYATAPVSALLYKGTLPELVFEKSLNTITKRHHIRVWYAGVVDGRELWLGAATHDTGAAFNLHSFRFTHAIDQNIDDERDKVTTDLRFAGCVDSEMRVDRPAAASALPDSRTFTDGAATVLSMTDCQASDAPIDATLKPGNRLSRLARRMILEARNHVERENLYYWTYQLIKRAHNHSSS